MSGSASQRIPKIWYKWRNASTTLDAGDRFLGPGIQLEKCGWKSSVGISCDVFVVDDMVERTGLCGQVGLVHL